MADAGRKDIGGIYFKNILATQEKANKQDKNYVIPAGLLRKFFSLIEDSSVT